MHIKLYPRGATYPRAIQTAFIAWFIAPAPTVCISTDVEPSLNEFAILPATFCEILLLDHL